MPENKYGQNTIIFADAMKGLKSLKECSVDCCVTSPPYYGLRDYGVNGQIGMESSPYEYIRRLTEIFREVRRVLKDDGTLWVVISDSYAGSGKGAWSNKNGQKESYVPEPGSAITKMPKTFEGIKAKDLIGIPWMLAFALREDGWYLRQDIIWHKPNAMPESVKDRCTKSHEYIFLLSKSKRYYFDAPSIAEEAKSSGRSASALGSIRYGGNKYTSTPDAFYRTKSGTLYSARKKRNKRDVWTISTRPFKGAHFATFPEELISPCILSGCREGGVVLDPFCGTGTTLQVASSLGRDGVGIEINKDYEPLISKRLGAYCRIELP